jgi:glutamate racemase
LIAGDKVTLVSSAEETAKDVYRTLVENDLLRDPKAGAPKHVFLATGKPFTNLARRFLGPEVNTVESL